MAELRAFAVATLGTRRLEHTYATSSDGYSWSCFGRDSAGRLLSYASGDSLVADCLARPIQPPAIYAGIIYGITGLCHQAANRVLYPAGITVAGSGGFGASIIAYGTYGRGAWPEKDQCVRLTVGHPSLPSGNVLDMPQKDAISKLSTELHAIRAVGGASEFEASRKELQALADASLGTTYDQSKIGIVIECQQFLRKEQESLARQLLNHRIERQEYLNKFNQLLERVYSRCQDVLGKTDFEKLFGMSLDQIEQLVDPDVFLAAH